MLILVCKMASTQTFANWIRVVGDVPELSTHSGENLRSERFKSRFRFSPGGHDAIEETIETLAVVVLGVVGKLV